MELNQEQLGKELGITRSKLNAHENGQTVNPTVEDLFRFSDYFKIGIDTLLRTDLSAVSESRLTELQSASNDFVSGRNMKVLATTVDRNNVENIEYVPVKARAGYLAGFSDPEFISQLPTFTMPQLPRDRKFRMFSTTGDSMYPIPENCLVIGNYVDDWNSLKPETPCIVVTRHEGIVFKLVTSRIKERRSLLLASLNASYEPYEVNVADVLEVWQFVNYISDTIPAGEQSLQQISQSVYEIRNELRRLAAKGR